MNLGWPVTPGRYVVGNKSSCVAICTLASIDLIDKLKDYLNEIAIVGKAVTENIGIEKIVLNIISNPNIRFIILCGRESYGHYVGQAIISLIENGVEEDGRIKGAKGPLATLKNLSKEQIETFRKQIKAIDLIGCEEIEKIMKKVRECIENNPGPFEGFVKLEKLEPIVAWHDERKDVVLDPKGFFTIVVDREKERIIVEHYTAEWDENKSFEDWKKCLKSHRLNKIIVGKNAEEICHTILREGLLSRFEHAAYLGRELQKAEIALKYNLPYEQDKEIILKRR